MIMESEGDLSRAVMLQGVGGPWSSVGARDGVFALLFRLFFFVHALAAA